MEHRKAMTSTITMIESSNNNHSLHQRKKRTTKRQQLQPSSLSSIPNNDQHSPSVSHTGMNSNHIKTHLSGQQKENTSMKRPLAWTKKWTKWFSPCGSQRVSRSDSNTISTPTLPVDVSEHFIFNIYTCYEIEQYETPLSFTHPLINDRALSFICLQFSYKQSIV